jgi:hypothetical protein
MTEQHDYVGVHGNAKTVYVLIASRAKFDEIPLPVSEHDHRALGKGHVLSKMIEAPELWVIFQHWIVDVVV